MPSYAGEALRQHRSAPLDTESLCPRANRWKCPVVIVSIPFARHHEAGSFGDLKPVRTFERSRSRSGDDR